MSEKSLITLDQKTVTRITAQPSMWVCTTAKHPDPLIKQLIKWLF